jgi:hypothetical protein
VHQRLPLGVGSELQGVGPRDQLGQIGWVGGGPTGAGQANADRDKQCEQTAGEQQFTADNRQPGPDDRSTVERLQ